MNWYIYDKGKAFNYFMQSIQGFHKYDKIELSNIDTQCIIEYTSLLLDRIHWQEHYRLEFQLEYPTGYYLTNETNQGVRIKDSLTHIVAEPTTEFIWQAYLLVNAYKVLNDLNDIVVAYGDLLWMYSGDYLNTFKWEPNINEFLEPKVSLEDSYARVECCWIDQNELGLYKELCEYDIQENVIQLKERNFHLLLPPWGSEDYYESPLKR